MLHDKQCSQGWTFDVDDVQAYFSCANKGTKVSRHTLHAFPGLIT